MTFQSKGNNSFSLHMSILVWFHKYFMVYKCACSLCSISAINLKYEWAEDFAEEYKNDIAHRTSEWVGSLRFWGTLAMVTVGLVVYYGMVGKLVTRVYCKQCYPHQQMFFFQSNTRAIMDLIGCLGQGSDISDITATWHGVWSRKICISARSDIMSYITQALFKSQF